MKFDIDDFQVKDAQPTGYLPSEDEVEIKLVEEVKDENVFHGEIIYTENEENIEKNNGQTAADLEKTKMFSPDEMEKIEEILNSDLFKNEESEAESHGEEDLESDSEQNFHEDETASEVYEEEQDDPVYASAEENDAEEQEEYLEEEEYEEQEELEGLGDLNYHDDDDEVPVPVLAAPVEKREKTAKAERPAKSERVKKTKRPAKAEKSLKAVKPVKTENKEKSGDAEKNVKKAPVKKEQTNADSTHGKPIRRVAESVSSGNDGNNGKGSGPNRKENALKRFISSLSPMDIGIGLVGVALIVVLVVVANIFVVQKLAVTKVGSFASVGNQLENLTEIGNFGIKGVITQAADNVEIMATDSNDEVIPITVTFTSVEKDLKIKFENKYEETLIENVPFEIDAVGPDKQEYHWMDEDKDGIIYQEKMVPGEYLVTIKSIDKYSFPDTATKVTVKDKITYTAINIINEIKTEDQIDVAKEDTEKKEEIEEEPLLKDTVEWIESTKTIVSGADGYATIDKAKIKDPETLVASVIRFWKATDKEIKVGDTCELTIPNLDKEKYEFSFSWSSENADIASVDGAADKEKVTVKGNKTGTAKISCVITRKDKTTNESQNSKATFEIAVKEITSEPNSEPSSEPNSEPNSEPTSEPASEVTETPIEKLELKSEKLTLRIKETQTLTAIVTPSKANQNVKWESSKPEVVEIEDGKLTALKAGEATITCTSVAKDKSGKQLSVKCEVKVTDKLTITLKEKTGTVLLGDEYNLESNVTVTGYKETSKLKYESSNKDIATVDEKGVITGVAEGTAEITITTEEKDTNDKGEEAAVSVKFVINVKANPKKDTNTLLKDESGKQVFIKNAEGKYVEAKWADYYTAETFYIQSEVVYKYTGWQTIKNKTYFFTSEGKAVTGEQVIQGVKYNFASDGTLSMNGGVLGIDVSKWNGTIDWNAVKNSGISYVIVRCGYRGSATGVLVKDPKFDSFVSGANAAGLKVGLYFFSQAITEVEAVEEASMAISLAKSYKISYPVFIDTEKTPNGRANNISKETRTAVCKAFCETVKSAGYTSGIYASKTWYTDQLNMSTLNAYKIWLAQYASQPSYAGRYDMWQYTSRGSVKGISGNVDMNISYLGY